MSDDDQIVADLKAYSTQKENEIKTKGVSKWESQIMDMLISSGLSKNNAGAILVAMQLMIKGEKLRDGV